MLNRSLRIAGAVSCILTAVLISLSCNKTSPTDSFHSWSFSGYVIDGYSQRPLSGVSIRYANENGDRAEVLTDGAGAFQIGNLPFGDRTFHFSFTPADSNIPRYTERIDVISGRVESSASVGELGDVSKVIKIFPLSGSVSGKLMVKLRESQLTKPAAHALVRMTFKNSELDNAVPTVFDALTDSTGTFFFDSLPVSSGATMTASAFYINNTAYAQISADTVLLFPGRTVSAGTLYLVAQDTTNWALNLISSNVISKDGFGLTGIPIDIIPYYVLSQKPDSIGLEAAISGGGNPDALVTLKKDTVFVRPIHNFTFNELIAVTLTGKDTSGNRILLDFGGLKRFRTVKGITALASNTWTASNQPASNFSLFDTLWVKFSQNLDSNTSSITWSDPTADNAIFGSGAKTNANVWIHQDTLFVQPDLRLAVDLGETMGFKAVVTAVDGSQSSALDVKVNLVTDKYFVKWSNTKDQFGALRTDFGTMEPIKLLSNMPITEITGISPVAGSTSPPDMTLDNITLHGDTIIYQPSLRLESNTTYGMDFNVTFANGIKRQDVLATSWRTLSGVRILNTNNRQSGNYRSFAVWGDSLKVTFSKPIDTSAAAPTRFKVNMRDVHGAHKRTTVRWDTSVTRATIVVLDTLPTADFNAAPAYTSGATSTRAVDSVSFDCTTRDGEQAFKLRPENGNIEMHTEAGICPVHANVLSNHDASLAINVYDAVSTTFPPDGDIRLTFNRVLDTAFLKLREASSCAGIEERTSGVRLPCTISFGSDEKTLIIHPVNKLGIGKEYYIWLASIPGKGVAGAAAINEHAGSFSGNGSRNRLLNGAFKTQSPNIGSLAPTLAPDSNSMTSVQGGRLGASAGFVYYSVVGASNAITDASIKCKIGEVAWNQNHSDSVDGYQVQARKIDRRGIQTGWFTLSDTIPSLPWSVTNSTGKQRAEVNLTAESFYTTLITQDRDVSGSYYLNSAGLLNDSTQIQIRIRPFIGSGDPSRGEVGTWSAPLAYVDNVAPCDSDFVMAINCATLSNGGIQVVEHITFNNATGSGIVDTGYIELTFPEDMDPFGLEPSCSFFYGSFAGTNPIDSLKALPNGNKSGWVNARKYRIFVSIPAFDFTHGADGTGAFYTISVAGCIDASGNLIQTYGSNGNAVSSIVGVARPNRAAAATSQVQGSASVLSWFALCD